MAKSKSKNNRFEDNDSDYSRKERKDMQRSETRSQSRVALRSASYDEDESDF